MKIKHLYIPLLFFIVLSIGACKNKNAEKYKNMPKALMELSMAIDKNPKNHEALYNRAMYYYLRGKTDDALADILAAIKYKSDNMDYYILLSDVYFGQKETDLAEEALQKVLTNEPENNEARLKLAELYFHLNMQDECLKELDEAVALQPHNPKAHIIRAFIHKSMEDTVGYLRMLQLTIDQDPKEVKAFLELGYFYQQKMDPIAINYYNNALMVDPNNLEINYNLAKFYQDLGQYEAALQQYEVLLKISPNNKVAYNNIGFIKLAQDEYLDAIAYFDKSIAQDAEFVNAICNRGIAYFYLKDYAKAREDFKTSLKINPHFEPAINRLNALDKMGE